MKTYNEIGDLIALTVNGEMSIAECAKQIYDGQQSDAVPSKSKGVYSEEQVRKAFRAGVTYVDWLMDRGDNDFITGKRVGLTENEFIESLIEHSDAVPAQSVVQMPISVSANNNDEINRIRKHNSHLPTHLFEQSDAVEFSEWKDEWCGQLQNGKYAFRYAGTIARYGDKTGEFTLIELYEIFRKEKGI